MDAAILIVSLVLAFVVVNAGQQLLMKIMGADTMFFNMKTKLVFVFVAFLVIFGLIDKIFGVG